MYVEPFRMEALFHSTYHLQRGGLASAPHKKGRNLKVPAIFAIPRFVPPPLPRVSVWLLEAVPRRGLSRPSG